MKYLRGINESHSDKNEVFYTINDILLEFFDENGIASLPSEDKVSDYESYLSSDTMPVTYGYYIDTEETPYFDISKNKTDKEIGAVGVWNINKETVYKLLEYLKEERDRIKESTGYHIDTNVEEMDFDRVDVYINIIPDKEYNKKSKQEKISDYTYKIKNLSLSKLSDDKLKEALLLLDKLFEITK